MLVPILFWHLKTLIFDYIFLPVNDEKRYKN